MLHQPVRAVAFDFDGLMINSEDLYRESGADMIRSRGKEPDDAVFAAMMGRTNQDALTILKQWYGFADSVEELFAETERRMNALLTVRLRTMPGLLEFLDHLESKAIPKAVTTSATLPYLQRCLGQLHLASRFAFYVTSEDVRQGKPDPEIYLSAAERFGVSPSELLVLEDSNNGSLAAVAAGTLAVAVPNEHSGTIQADVHLVANSLSDPRLWDLIA